VIMRAHTAARRPHSRTLESQCDATARPSLRRIAKFGRTGTLAFVTLQFGCMAFLGGQQVQANRQPPYVDRRITLPCQPAQAEGSRQTAPTARTPESDQTPASGQPSASGENACTNATSQ